ncbi:hypothetical protein M9Y10_026394 [Tritrichomonas musculus]|uniref:receptor protein-tyrosine kinase n=1 Tax=Tritrichomonas musculus TaxID=1915356 RepID=A0ABR2H9T2_9EUKA
MSSQTLDQDQQPNIIDEDNFEDDDLVPFQPNSTKINLYYSQLTKYSKLVRETYLFSDVVNRLPQEIQQFQEKFQLLPENVDYFFQLSQHNYDIKEDSKLTYIQCIDLLKICNFLEVRKLSSKIKQYIKVHNIDVDFIIQMLEYNNKTQKETDNIQIEISSEIEDILTTKINECLSNEKFDQLPIQIIYRVVKQSSPNVINSNKLFDVIMKSLNKFCVLFPFVDLSKLSDDRLENLCEMYSKTNENTQHYFDYLKCNLNLINEINARKKNLEEMNDEQRNKMKELEEKVTSLENQFNASEKVNTQLQNELNDSKSLINEQQSKMKDIETLLQKQFNEQLQSQINYSKDLENQISQLKSKLSSSEKEITDIHKQLGKLFKIKGQVVASVEKGNFINAEINLKTKGPPLDTSKSKVIVSTSGAKSLGMEAYEKGEPITSLCMKTSFARKPGTYYVRCIVFNSEGESNEIVSNSVTTNGSCLTFDYEGKPAKIQLPQGQYKLEVWGAKGGDSTGQGDCGNRANQSIVKGGLGGYSRGILSLKQNETVYVYVGEEGHPSNSSEGSTTKGGFPDGGGTKTCHYNSSYPTVPGTGGGSTSIRIGSDTDYARVIVAGGGGGASGSCQYIDQGGFGGGSNGGNSSYYGGKQSNCGYGTQTGSTCGLGGACKGDSGSFGKGAEGKGSSGYDSGGGGGGGWYGGGSGGYGCCHPGSGGGGSGWTFTDSNFNKWKEGDSSNSSKCSLKSAYYLTDAVSLGGNEEIPKHDGNGTEHGHTGNGFAKITLL